MSHPRELPKTPNVSASDASPFSQHAKYQLGVARDITTPPHENPLDDALMQGHVESATIMIQKGAVFDKSRALHYIRNVANMNETVRANKLLEFFRAHKLSVNVAKFIEIPIMLNNHPMTCCFIDYAKKSGQILDVDQCLLFAINAKKIAMMIFFIENNADVNKVSSGFTPIFAALQVNDTEIMKYLLDHGACASINYPLYNQFTALYIAAQNGQFEMANLLIQYGAKIHLETNNPATNKFLSESFIAYVTTPPNNHSLFKPIVLQKPTRSFVRQLSTQLMSANIQELVIPPQNGNKRTHADIEELSDDDRSLFSDSEDANDEYSYEEEINRPSKKARY